MVTIPRVNSNVILHKGLFEESIPDFLKEYNPISISFLHIDCDLYSSTKTIFDFLGDFIKAGTVIIFDELICYHAWREHEYKAWMEFVKRNVVTFHYTAFSGMRAGLIIDKINGE
jgi:hypothetical protein